MNPLARFINERDTAVAVEAAIIQSLRNRAADLSVDGKDASHAKLAAAAVRQAFDILENLHLPKKELPKVPHQGL